MEREQADNYEFYDELLDRRDINTLKPEMSEDELMEREQECAE
jgi:hypothetical protein